MSPITFNGKSGDNGENKNKTSVEQPHIDRGMLETDLLKVHSTNNQTKQAIKPIGLSFVFKFQFID
ncbi:MAG: hypothetical protein HWE27_16375 [Gammaproteobacteria bacterium]|nr:hypothetical protein [Gammaproteobacteria bacterium]